MERIWPGVVMRGMGSERASEAGGRVMVGFPLEKVRWWRVVVLIWLEPVRFWLEEASGRAMVAAVMGRGVVPKALEMLRRMWEALPMVIRMVCRIVVL
jgi:hypothetical protein